jgi:hypothetical protein
LLVCDKLCYGQASHQALARSSSLLSFGIGLADAF